MPNFAIETDNLTFDYRTGRALDGLSIQVPSGAIFGFLGPNGAGKTTTIRLLLGLLEPAAGRARVLGYDTRSQGDAIRSRTGVLFEYSGLYERLSAEENLDFYGRIWHLSASERRARIKELLSHFELWDRRQETAREWSRGMRQKLAIARTLMPRPSLIFLDEPTAGFDPVAAETLHDDLRRLATNEGVTLFLTTHNLAEAEKLCAQVAVIRAGKLLAVGSPAELSAQRGGSRVEIMGSGFDDQMVARLRERPEVVAVEVRSGVLHIQLCEGARAAPLVSLLVQAGAQIEEVRKPQTGLAEVFLTLVKEDESP
ncbi:MAG: ABC transporter ATP-binding protein [Chloroflexi bacterium]|nr:ABC transporter ATP-binding protein [Chloroflexota bacterium]